MISKEERHINTGKQSGLEENIDTANTGKLVC